jgi:hypothetical protein
LASPFIAAASSGCLPAKKIPELSAAVCSEDAVGYEKLRSCALSGTLAHGVTNFGVLMQRGLAAWLSAAPPPQPRQPPPNMPNGAPLPAALASIILRLTKEDSYA